LTEVNHPDHLMIVYPGLGHTFVPSNQWITSHGQMEEYVFADLYAWLESHSGFAHIAAPISSSNVSSSSSPTTR
jgi:uncharacterized protein